MYEDLYKFLIRHSSSKEIDVLLELINRVDWGMLVRVDEYQLAKDVNTTVKYVREVLNKFTSPYKGKRILDRVDKTTYKLLRGKSTVLHRKSDIYCKKFEYLYGNDFKSLSVYGKRIMLKASMSFSLSGQGKAYLPVDEFIYRNEISSGLIPSRSVLLEELERINKTFKGVYVSLACVLSKKGEYIYVEVDNNLIEDVRHNYSERDYLRNTLFEEGYVDYLEDEYCIEIEKVGKHIFNYLILESSGHSKDYNGDFTHDMMDVAREFYAMSIKRVAKYLHKLMSKGESSKGVSAYFSSVVFSVLLENAALIRNKKISIENVIFKMSADEREKEYHNRVINLELLLDILDQWCYTWFKARFKKDERNYSKNSKNIESNNTLKDYIHTVLRDVGDKIKYYGVKSKKGSMEWLQRYKNIIGDFIDMQNDKMMSPIV